MEVNKIYQGDVREVLKTFSDKSVHCIVTSPPYYGLRDYGTAVWIDGDENCDHKGEAMRTRAYVNENCGTGNDLKNKENHQFFKSVCSNCGAKRIDAQIGLEETPESFIETMVEVLRECKRVLRNDGTLWLNIGDSYAAGSKNRTEEQSCRKSNIHGSLTGQICCKNQINKVTGNLKPKDLIGIPWMLAFALRKDGWYLRQDIIWHKPNPMPESVTDRCTKAHEYIFLLSKSAKYFYDSEAIKQVIADASIQRLSQDIENQKGSERVPGKTNGNMKAVLKKHKNILSKGQQVHSMHKARLGLLGNGFAGHSGNYDANGEVIGNGMANKRSVWTVTTKPFSEAHFATFPEDLITDCIKAGCPENGIVLDPFMGAGTTALVAAKLNRNFVGIELNPTYIKIAEKRLKTELGMFNPLAHTE